MGILVSQVAFAQSQTPPPRSVARGPYAVTVESYRSLASHTAYHPTDLSSWGTAHRLPIVSWGNGACARNGMAFAEFFTQIASHGYLVISVGPKRRKQLCDPLCQRCGHSNN